MNYGGYEKFILLSQKKKQKGLSIVLQLCEKLRVPYLTPIATVVGRAQTLKLGACMSDVQLNFALEGDITPVL